MTTTATPPKPATPPAPPRPPKPPKTTQPAAAVPAPFALGVAWFGFAHTDDEIRAAYAEATR